MVPRGGVHHLGDFNRLRRSGKRKLPACLLGFRPVRSHYERDRQFDSALGHRTADRAPASGWGCVAGEGLILPPQAEQIRFSYRATAGRAGRNLTTRREAS